MPWKKSGSGYTTPNGGFSRNPDQYETLKAKGLPKSEAAAISNKGPARKNAPPPKKK